MRARLLRLVVPLLVAMVPLAPAEASPSLETPLDPVCAEPGGQTDTPPHPRLRRAVVDGVAVAVVLPRGYATSGRRYPVLYLLHGAQGDEDSWIEYGGLLSDSGARPVGEQAIVVMPRMSPITGLAVDWVDGYRHDATLIGRTLVDWVDQRWRTRADRRHRAIAGYSGGGLSAAHVAERFPGVFGQLGVLSGAVDLGNPAGQPAAYAMFEAEKVCAGDDPRPPGPSGIRSPTPPRGPPRTRCAALRGSATPPCGCPVATACPARLRTQPTSSTRRPRARSRCGSRPMPSAPP